MKRIHVLLFTAGIALLSACKEKGPTIDMGTQVVAKDTTYVTTQVPDAQKRVVLAEEFTGATCPNCPAARDLLSSIAAQYPGQVAVMEMHINNFVQSSPAAGAKFDLRTGDGTDIGSTFYTIIDAMPSAGINRKPVNNQILLYTPSWSNAIQNSVTETPKVNLEVKSTYDATSKNATIVVTATYTQQVSAKQYLSLAILEDNIVDIQEFPTSFDNNYTFKHTFRDLVTAISGDEFLKDMPAKEPGRVYQRTFIYPVDGKWNPDNCKVVAFVHNNESGNKEVLQAAETELKGQ